MTDDLKGRISYSPVVQEDLDDLVALRIAAMRESLERINHFDPERARLRLTRSFDPLNTQWINLDGARVGFYVFKPGEDGFDLDHLYVHPNFQGNGIGAVVLRHLIAIADEAGLGIRLGALRESDANRFYQRYGFEQVGEGEWDIYYVRPAGNAS